MVITGGEPLLYDLSPLCLALENLGKMVQVESSGTCLPRISSKTWLTLSPKLNMPGGKSVLSASVMRPNEFKMPVGKQDDIDKLHAFIAEHTISVPVLLQPLSQSKSATQLCIAEVLKNNWRLSIQTHKYINIR